MKNKIAVITHKSPDYDAICSASSLSNYLMKTSKENEVYLVLDDNSIKDNLYGLVKSYSILDVSKVSFDYIYICDVNEEDRTYGLELIEKVPKSNRFLIDHHDMNRKELDILNENKIINPKSSSTCELLIENLDINLFSREELKNLYMGILSDTACFTRGVTNITNQLIDKINLTLEEKKKIEEKVYSLSDTQKEIYNKVREIDLEVENVKGYIVSSSKDITSLIKHPAFDNLTKPTEKFPVSIFIIEIENNYFIKFKKLEECELDILKIASYCNGGGHENRCAGRFYNSSLDEVLYILKDLLKQNDKKLVKVIDYDSSNK